VDSSSNDEVDGSDHQISLATGFEILKTHDPRWKDYNAEVWPDAFIFRLTLEEDGRKHYTRYVCRLKVSSIAFC
jgi:hypothetical protein